MTLSFLAVATVNIDRTAISCTYACRPGAILPILKRSVCTNINSYLQSQRKLPLYHRAITPIIAVISFKLSCSISLGVNHISSQWAPAHWRRNLTPPHWITNLLIYIIFMQFFPRTIWCNHTVAIRMGSSQGDISQGDIWWLLNVTLHKVFCDKCYITRYKCIYILRDHRMI